jgi:hypothetical protein
VQGGFKPWAEPSRTRLGRAKPGPGDGLTGLWARPEMFESTKPLAQAEALVVFFGELSGGWEIYFEPRFGGSILFCHFQIYSHAREGNRARFSASRTFRPYKPSNLAIPIRRVCHTADPS